MGTPGRAAAVAAVVLGVASAAVSAWWTAGGTALLDTVGGSVERLAREGGPGAVVAGAGTVLAKLVAAGLAAGLLRAPARWVRVLALLAGALLVLWGGANVVVGGAVLSGLVDVGPVADVRALRWHVACWDAWFLVWGAALLVAAGSAARAQRGGAVDPRSSSTGSTSSARGSG